MLIDKVLAVVAVADIEASVAWYATLLNRPPDARPMEGLADWHITDTAWVQVYRDDSAAGRGLLNLAVDDVDQAAAELSERGIVTGEVVAASQGVRLLPVIDLDGNTVTLVESPRS